MTTKPSTCQKCEGDGEFYYGSDQDGWERSQCEDCEGTGRKRSDDLLKAVKELEFSMQCNCDLDRWEPEKDTGHSWVCRIHRAAKGGYKPTEEYGGQHV